MGTFSDGFLTRFMAISGVRAFFIWSHFQRNTTRPVAKYEEKIRISLKLWKLPDCEIRKDFDDNVFHDKTPFVGRNFYMLHYISLS